MKTIDDVIDLIFPNLTLTKEEIEAKYPKRDLTENQFVTRFAPSPTGFMHIGNFFTALIDYIIAKKSNGVFYLRNEDTDKKREVEGALETIVSILNTYGLSLDEYELDGEIVGNYGPYVQSERKEIYHAYIKYLLKIGRAYPCFCTKEELEDLRVKQEKTKIRPGYYGRFAKCRNLSYDEMYERISNNVPYVIRFKSLGDGETTREFYDEVRGKVNITLNDLDVIIMKSDNLLPTYHFAHVIDDYLMHTTHVVRGEDWLPSLPIHLELFEALGYEAPKYIHISNIMKTDNGVKRKISKRKDPEASMTYYLENGYPETAVIEYLMTIVNSNYEDWRKENPDASFTEFEFKSNKMSSSGALFDLDKLINISKLIISKMNKEEIFDASYNWAKNYSEKLLSLIEKDKEYYENILNIEREQEKPRKDIYCYNDIYNNIWYMYDEEFYNNLNYEIEMDEKNKNLYNICLDYVKSVYLDTDSKEEWFNKIKEICTKNNIATDMKEYKNNPDSFIASIADVTNVIRVVLTTKTRTPDLYEIMRLLGKNRIIERFEKFKEFLK